MKPVKIECPDCGYYDHLKKVWDLQMLDGGGMRCPKCGGWMTVEDEFSPPKRILTLDHERE